MTDPAMGLALGPPIWLDTDSPEWRRMYIEMVSARAGGLGRLALVDGLAGATVRPLEAQRAKRRARRERPL